MRFQSSPITLFFATLTMSSVARAGTIACLNQQQSGGVGLIPAHNAEFEIDGQTYIGTALAENCGQMLGGVHDGFSTFAGGNGKTASADFWITGDGCLNIETGGNHYFCCPEKINQGLHDLTTCNF